MGAVLKHWINYNVWIHTAAALWSDRRDIRSKWILQWELLETTRLSLWLWVTQIFWHLSPWTLAENVCWLLSWGRDSSERGWDCHGGWQGAQQCVCAWGCACVQCPCPRHSGRELSSAGQRMCLCFWRSCRMVLEARLLLYMRTSVSFELTGLSANRYSQTLARLFENVQII